MSQTKYLVVVRIRGTINVREDMKDTLRMLRLNKVNNATIIPPTPQYLGMLQKAKDYITWGEISQETLTRLLKKRGRMIKGKPISSAACRASSMERAMRLAGTLKPIPSMAARKSSRSSPFFTGGGRRGV